MPSVSRFTVCAVLALRVLAHEASAQPSPPPDRGPAGPDPAAQPAPPADPADRAPPAVPAAAPPGPTAAPAGGAAGGSGWTSLRLLRDKGVISEAEYASAVRDLGAMVGAGEATTLVVSKLATTLYGYVEGNMFYDSTQSCQEFCGNAQIQKPGTYRGDHGRTIFSPRNSRFGVRIAAPETHGIRVSGLIETDFLGPTTTTEQGQWSNPVLRVRHAYVKLDTPIVDILIGQTWNLFGQQPNYFVASVQRPGIPGQLFARTSQLKLGKTLRSHGVTTELAVAANRPPQEDSSTPEGVASVRLLFDGWTGLHTGSLSSAVAIQPASLAVSGDLRKFRIAEFSATPQTGHVRIGGGVAFDAYLPIIPATKQAKANALSLTGELAIGSGTSDTYLALGAAGTRNAAIPSATAPAGLTYPANFDPGLAAYDATGHLELIKWTSYVVGLDYYPPGMDGRLGVVASYGHIESSNAGKFGGAQVMDPALGSTRDHESMIELGGFVDPTSATRIAAGGAVYSDRYVDGTTARNYALGLVGWLFF